MNKEFLEKLIKSFEACKTKDGKCWVYAPSDSTLNKTLKYLKSQYTKLERQYGDDVPF